MAVLCACLSSTPAIFGGDSCAGRTGQWDGLDVAEAGLATPPGEIAAEESGGVTGEPWFTEWTFPVNLSLGAPSGQLVVPQFGRPWLEWPPPTPARGASRRPARTPLPPHRGQGEPLPQCSSVLSTHPPRPQSVPDGRFRCVPAPGPFLVVSRCRVRALRVRAEHERPPCRGRLRHPRWWPTGSRRRRWRRRVRPSVAARRHGADAQDSPVHPVLAGSERAGNGGRRARPPPP